MLRTWMIMWKEFIQISRDPRLLTVVVVLPVLMLLLYGYAINLDVKHVRLGIYDQDHSRSSRDLIGAFTHSEYFDLVAILHSEKEVTTALDGGEVQVAVIIPYTFDTDLASGRTVPVQVLVDGSDSTTASTALGYTGGVLQQYSVQLAMQALRRAGPGAGQAALPVDLRTRFWYNPELRSTNFIIPGLIAVILMVLSALLTSVTIVRERERGTIESLIVSPVKPIELMVGKLVPYVVIAFCDVLMVMLVSVLLYHIPLRGNPLLVLVASGIFLTAALGIGLLVSTVAPNQQVALMFGLLATQLPSVLLSGFIFPISSMPPFVQALSNIIPATHFIKLLRGLFLKGISFDLFWQPALILLATGLLVLTLSTLRFRKKLS
ncbi:MAG: ABC transporter permease [Armatimonadota bacterium]